MLVSSRTPSTKIGNSHRLRGEISQDSYLRLDKPRNPTDTVEAPIRLPDSYITTGHAVSDGSHGFRGTSQNISS